MEFGTYILSVNNSCSVWNQPAFENYPIRYSKEGIELLSVNDKNVVCNTNLLDNIINDIKDKDSVIQKIVSHLPFIKTPKEFISIMKLKIPAGNRYSHIYRPVYVSKYREINGYNPIKEVPSEQCFDLPIDNNSEYNDYIRQLSLIISDLFEVFKTVEPNNDNMNVYGNAFRNIIIFACTEVDALMKTVSLSNGIKSKYKKFNTKHYVRFKEPMQIDRYTLCFQNIKELGEISPFKDWDQLNSTKSLSWYDAYNYIKHDRINNKEKANMRNAIDSVMAFAVVLMAQFGYRNATWNNNINKFIKVIKEPQWSIQDMYFPTNEGEDWNYIDYPNLVNRK